MPYNSSSPLSIIFYGLRGAARTRARGVGGLFGRADDDDENSRREHRAMCVRVLDLTEDPGPPDARGSKEPREPRGKKRRPMEWIDAVAEDASPTRVEDGEVVEVIVDDEMLATPDGSPAKANVGGSAVVSTDRKALLSSRSPLSSRTDHAGPCARVHHSATLVGGEVYVFGGSRVAGDGQSGAALGDLWAFNGAEGTWRLVTGAGVGVASSCVPLFISEVAPTALRGALGGAVRREGGARREGDAVIRPGVEARLRDERQRDALLRAQTRSRAFFRARTSRGWIRKQQTAEDSVSRICLLPVPRVRLARGFQEQPRRLAPFFGRQTRDGAEARVRRATRRNCFRLSRAPAARDRHERPEPRGRGVRVEERHRDRQDGAHHEGPRRQFC